MPALFSCGAARRVCITKRFKAESEAHSVTHRAQEMDGLRRQALASVIDSAPFAVGARVLVQMPAIPSDYQRFYRDADREPGNVCF